MVSRARLPTQLVCAVCMALVPVVGATVVPKHYETFVDSSTVGFFRFETTIPGAYWRHENQYTDHSGNDNHLDYMEAGNQVKYANSIDGNPENIKCSSLVGLGCTQLEYDGGYATDKETSTDWVAYDGSYKPSHFTPPISMFNVPASPEAYNISVRTSLYEVTTETFPAGGGMLSYNPGAITDESVKGLLFFNASRTNPTGSSKMSFSDDFTIEGFFRATYVDDSTEMTIVEQKDGSEFCYKVYLLGQKLVFEVRGVAPGGGGLSTTAVTLDGSNYADGKWHYFVARYNKEASGSLSMSKLTVKVLDEPVGDAAGKLTYGLVSTPAAFNISTSGDFLYIGRSKEAGDPDSKLFKGEIDEVRISKGLVMDEDLLGKVAVDYTHAPGKPACQTHTTLTNTMGVFDDGSAADVEYANDMMCEWLIDQSKLNPATTQAFIALKFNRFSTEPGTDVVQVFDGADSNAALLGEFSGYDVPPTIPLLSTGPKMLVRFITDGRQTGQQLGWEAKYVAISLASKQCNSVNEGHDLALSCPSGYKIGRVNFASYGTPKGYCSNGAGAGVGEQRDVSGFLYNDNSNPNGVSKGADAGAGAGGDDGTVLFKTSFCHANNSKTVVESMCMNKASCTIPVNDATFGADPCTDFDDSKLGSKGTDDKAVQGADSFPRTERPYATQISKRLFVQVTCEGDTSFAANCYDECKERGQCLYGMSEPYCAWCTKYGLKPTQDGGYEGMGCGSSFCVKEAQCGAPKASSSSDSGSSYSGEGSSYSGEGSSYGV